MATTYEVLTTFLWHARTTTLDLPPDEHAWLVVVANFMGIAELRAPPSGAPLSRPEPPEPPHCLDPPTTPATRSSPKPPTARSPLSPGATLSPRAPPSRSE
ncbi:hypothetical protein GUJ93_ZPchr0009g789 [Zizania palustris]|uniref:Uncharacterized protein n=1 Tax=Zizania palustris TaxID=103762 RepID=A0A8J5R1G8_ZIZPA|nr:hypothetical protein GUJ93_ZPchr0009g789 [Zizania palustris]